MHEISTVISDRVTAALDPQRPYKLTLEDGMRIGREERRKFVEAIASTILDKLSDVYHGRIIGSDRKGRAWQFCEESPSEREYYEQSSGLKFEFTEAIDPLDWGDVPEGLVNELSRLLAEADKKFASHHDAVRCVVLDPYGSMRWSTDDTWAELLRQSAIPASVNEIWISMHAELTDLACGWVHQCLWPTLSPAIHSYCETEQSVDDTAPNATAERSV